MPPAGSNKKVANSLVTLSSAAILTVYAAGLLKTRAAAEEMEKASNDRRPPMPAPEIAGELVTPAPIEPPSPVVTPTTALSPAVSIPAPAATPAIAKASADKLTKAAVADVAPSAKVVKPATVPTPAAAAPVVPAPVPANTEVVTEPATPKAADATPAVLMPKEIYRDGTYLGWGTSRHGDIQSSITIENGRFVAASIAQCWTRYSCSWVSHLPGQVITRQSPDVDYVSGATQSANAFYWGIIDALKKAK